MAAEDRLSFVSNLCSLGMRPLITAGLFRLMLIRHFADADNIEHPQLKGRIATFDADTGILIEDASVWTPEKTAKRPGIFIKRNRWECLKYGTLDSVKGIDSDGNREYMKLWKGSHTLFAISGESAEAEILGAEVYRFFLHFGPVFRQYLDLLAFDLAEVGEMHEIEEATEHFVIPITVGYGWSDSWVIREHTTEVKHIKLSELFGVWDGSEE